MRIALNGFGRIGKLVLRDLIETGVNAEIALLNEPFGELEQHALLLEFDTVHGRWDADISAEIENSRLNVGSTSIEVTTHKSIEDLPLSRMGIDLVVDCTGIHKSKVKLAPYYAAGVKKVIVSAPVKDDDALNLVFGVNSAAASAGSGTPARSRRNGRWIAVMPCISSHI